MNQMLVLTFGKTVFQAVKYLEMERQHGTGNVILVRLENIHRTLML